MAFCPENFSHDVINSSDFQEFIPPNEKFRFFVMSIIRLRKQNFAASCVSIYEIELVLFVNHMDCFSRIGNLIDAEINNGSKDYDKEYIRKHVDKLTF